MTSNTKPKPKRKLIIPHKRALIPGKPSSSRKKNKVPLSLNPSALPAEIQFRRPVFSSVGAEKERDKIKEEEEEEDGGDTTQERVRDTKTNDDDVIRIEFDSSQAPQPFLEPDVLDRIRERARIKMEQKKQRVSGGDDEEEEEEQAAAAAEVRAELSTEREIRRRAVETEYGSMAIKGRSVVSRRGIRRRR